MKTIQAILALTFAALFVSVFSFTSEGAEAEREIQIKIEKDGEAIAIEADDMEVGETRQSYTDSGKEVLLTRTAEGFDLSVDGKQIDIGIPHGDHHSSVFVRSGDAAKVIVHKMSGDGEDHEYSFVHGDGDHGEHTWVEHGGEGDHMIFIERTSAADHLQESGVLDDLDDETRQRILDTLKEIEPQTHIKKHVRVEVHEDIHEDG